MSNRQTRTILLACLLAVVFASIAQAQTPRRALTHEDYDAWRSIFGPTLTSDGRFLIYSFMPQEGDGELVVRNLQTGREHREGVGALPPPPLPDPEAEEPPVARSVRIFTTSDSRFVVATTFPLQSETARAKRAGDRAEMPKGGLLILDLESMDATRVANVKSVFVPARGGAWAAWLEEPAPEAKPEPGAKPERGAKPTWANGDSRPVYGTSLVLRDLARGADRRFADAVDVAFARDGDTLLYTVSSRTEDGNGVYAVTPGRSGDPAALVRGKGKYSRLAWNRAQTEAAFVTNRDDQSSTMPRFAVYRWTRGAASASAVVNASTAGFPAGMTVSDKAGLAFSRDGSKLYVPAAPPPAPPVKDVTPADERVVVDLWHWQDDLIQPMQRIRANRERNRTYRGVYHIAERRYVQVADESLNTVLMSDAGTEAIGLDDRPYRRLVDFDGTYNDVYLVDTSNGTRKLAVRQLRGSGFGGGGPLYWSPDGKAAFYYQDQHWHVLDAASGATRNATDGLGVAVYDEADDTPDPAGPYGQAGWVADSQSFLVYDKYDVWQIYADGRPATNLTEGEGRKAKIEFRVQVLEPPDEDDEARGIAPDTPLYLRAVSEETRATGFYQDGLGAQSAPRRLLWEDRNFRIAAKAREADVVVVSASRFDEYPDLHTTTSAFSGLKKATNGGAQMDAFLWGRGELMSFTNADGVPLAAALYKPQAFDPSRKYPLMVYIYEGLSQNVHNFVNPAPGHNVNFSLYVSNGYLVLTPDIVYTEGQPGQDALKCVLPAVQALVDQGFVDEERIGIQGHSWGGYQIAYMLTQTNRFRAAEAGAPVANMTSAYSGIRWGSGLPRQFQYEQTQSRIGVPLYDAPHKYLESSPIFHVKRVETPLLILHDDNDDAVPWYQGIELFMALRRTGKEAYLFNYNGEFHGLRRRQNQKDFAVRMQQFFDHYLKDAPKPEWMEEGIPFIERETEKRRTVGPAPSPQEP